VPSECAERDAISATAGTSETVAPSSAATNGLRTIDWMLMLTLLARPASPARP
jgi:hypothetical protein